MESSAMAMFIIFMVMVGSYYGKPGVEATVACTKEWKSSSKCNKTLTDLFTVEMFEGMFKHRNDRVAHAPGFWSYGGFLTAAKAFEKAGFGSTGGDDVQKRELAAFFAHVAHETSCGWPGSKDGQYAWGLCYNQELSPGDIFCKEDLLYPCAPGAKYYGRGALPLYWNYNYGVTGAALHQDLLRHPDILSSNETVAWQAAIWYWMTPAKTRPSPHQVMVPGKWVPSETDALASRHPGFGMTINIKASNGECGHGDGDTRMQDRIGHYLYFLENFFGGLDPGLDMDCASQGVLLLEFAAL